LADSSQPKLEFATKLEESVYLRVTRFYFHLHNDMDVPDDDGKELHNLEAAHAHAIRMARFEVSEAVVRDGRIVLSDHIDVEDGNGAVLATISFRDAVKIEDGRVADELTSRGRQSTSARNRIDHEERGA
jgi:hypothetical protein